MKFLLDYLTFSLVDVSSIFAQLDYLFGSLEWEVKTGLYGYEKSYYYSGIRVLYTKYNDGNYKACFSLSGQGCRTVEFIKGETFEWHNFLKDLLYNYENNNINFSRVDVALDIFDNSVPSMETICRYVDNNKYVSTFRRNMFAIGSEEWVYFGSPTSDVRLRIYNKALEQKVNKKWIRFEYQLRNLRANNFILSYVMSGNLGHCVLSLLNNNVKFTSEINTGVNTDRLKPIYWWENLIKSAGQLTLFEKHDYFLNFDKLKDYLVTQVAPSLYTYMACHGFDVSCLDGLLESGKARLNTDQQQLINEFGVPDEKI